MDRYRSQLLGVACTAGLDWSTEPTGRIVEVSHERLAMADDMVGCGRVVGSVGADETPDVSPQASSVATPQEVPVTARVGQKAPDFTAPSYYKGTFTPVNLSSFAGKWVLLCFYPGDFTFV